MNLRYFLVVNGEFHDAGKPQKTVNPKTLCLSGDGAAQKKLSVLNSVSEKVAKGRNDKLEEVLISTYAALEHNKGTTPL